MNSLFNTTSDQQINTNSDLLSENTNRKNISALLTSESNEWYTPPNFLDLVYQVMGEIDLDPCSNRKMTVKAKLHYIGLNGDDGLTHNWYGSIFMNPPYGGQTKKWCSYLRDQFDIGNCTEYLVLVASNTDTDFFHSMVRHSDITVFRNKRMQFIPAEGNVSKNGSTVKNVVFYKGNNLEKFKEVFKDFGVLMELID